MASTPSQDDAVRPPLRERKRLRTQRLLYDTAIELISDAGYEQVSVEEICERAEVGRATFFRYFGSKAGLMVEFDRRIGESIHARLTDAQSASDQLRIVEQTMSEAWDHVHPNVLALGRDYLSSTAVKDMRHVVAEISGLVEEILDRGVERGEFAALMPTRELARHFVMSVRVGIYAANRRPDEPKAPSATVVDLYLHGIATD